MRGRDLGGFSGFSDYFKAAAFLFCSDWCQLLRAIFCIYLFAVSSSASIWFPSVVSPPPALRLSHDCLILLLFLLLDCSVYQFEELFVSKSIACTVEVKKILIQKGGSWLLWFSRRTELWEGREFGFLQYGWDEQLFTEALVFWSFWCWWSWPHPCTYDGIPQLF